MKKSIIIISIAVAVILIGSGSPKKESQRDYRYESYVDSIYKNDVNYYLDVIVESDEFQQYVEAHGEWWDCEDY